MPTNRQLAKQEADIYAETLFEAQNKAGGQDAVLEVRAQIEEIIAYNRSHVDLTDALKDMSYSPEQRKALVEHVFADCASTLQSMLGVMAERGDIDMLSRVWNGYNREIAEKLHVVVVDVTTRVALDDHLRKVITDKVSADLGSNIVLREQVDPSILGGIVMSANGKRIDASVASLIDRARTVLKQTSSDGGEC